MAPITSIVIPVLGMVYNICVPKRINRVPTIRTVQRAPIILPVALDDLGAVTEVP